MFYSILELGKLILLADIGRCKAVITLHPVDAFVGLDLSFVMTGPWVLDVVALVLITVC